MDLNIISGDANDQNILDELKASEFTDLEDPLIGTSVIAKIMISRINNNMIYINFYHYGRILSKKVYLMKCDSNNSFRRKIEFDDIHPNRISLIENVLNVPDGLVIVSFFYQYNKDYVVVLSNFDSVSEDVRDGLLIRNTFNYKIEQLMK